MKESTEKNENQSTNRSVKSLDSIPEIGSRKEFYFRGVLILINAISLILGIIILKNRNYNFKKTYKFSYPKNLFSFVIIYSLGMIFALFISFLIIGIIKIIKYFTNKNNRGRELINNEENHSEISLNIINDTPNELAFLPYSFSYFIVITIILYFIALPWAMFLIYALAKNEIYSHINDFKCLYSLLIINAFAGFIMIIILILMAIVKRSRSFRKINFFINNADVDNIKKEIRNAMPK